MCYPRRGTTNAHRWCHQHPLAVLGEQAAAHTPLDQPAVVQGRVVQGMVDFEQNAARTGDVQQFMQADTRTFRAYAKPKAILDAMKKDDLTTVLVTTSSGQLLGALRR